MNGRPILAKVILSKFVGQAIKLRCKSEILIVILDLQQFDFHDFELYADSILKMVEVTEKAILQIHKL